MITWFATLPLVLLGMQSERVPIRAPLQARALHRVDLLDVRDLLLGSLPSPGLGTESQEAREQQIARQLSESAPTLQSLMRAFIRPAFDPALDQLEVTHDGKLVAGVSAEGHAWLAEFLTLQRRSPCLLDTQVRFVKGPRHGFDRFGLAGQAFVLLERERLDELLRLVSSHADGMTQISTPRLVLHNRARGNLSMLDTVSYVERWDVRIVEPGQQMIAAPVFGEVQAGFTLDVCPVVLSSSAIGVVVDVQQCVLEQPIATRKIRLSTPDQREVEVAEPKTTTVNLNATLVLEPHLTALFRAPLQDEASDIVVLLALRRVDALPAESPKPPLERR